MNIQCKLFKVFDSDEKKDIRDIYQNKFNEVTSNIISIEYEMNNYDNLLHQFYSFKSKQVIITSNIYFDLIELIITNNNILLRQIKFIESIDEEINKIINLELQKIYTKRENKLLKKLRIFNLSEGIDIKYIEFSIKCNNKRYNVKIFNNGIMYLDSEVYEYLLSIMKTSLSKVI